MDFIQHQTHDLADEPGSGGCREMECCLPKLHKAHSDKLQQTGAVRKIRKIPISVETQLSAACGKHSSSEWALIVYLQSGSALEAIYNL